MDDYFFVKHKKNFLNYYIYIKKASAVLISTKKLLLFSKFFITFICILYIYMIFDEKKISLENFYATNFFDFNLIEYFCLILVIILLFVNWSLEALKRYFLSLKLEKITFFNVFKSVVASVSIGLFTPQIIGDYFSNKYYLSSVFKAQSITIVFLCRSSQFFITIFYGTLAYICFLDLHPLVSTMFNPFFFIVLLLFTSVVFVIIFIKLPQINMPNWTLKFINFNGCIDFFNTISIYEHLILVAISWIRFCVFTMQYVLLLYIFDVDISKIDVYLNVWLTFFVKSILPTINFLNELGVREATALYFFGKSSVAIAPVLLASLMLWIINIMVPAILGLAVINLSKEKE